jgi:hypothetical protein
MGSWTASWKIKDLIRRLILPNQRRELLKSWAWSWCWPRKVMARQRSSLMKQSNYSLWSYDALRFESPCMLFVVDRLSNQVPRKNVIYFHSMIWLSTFMIEQCRWHECDRLGWIPEECCIRARALLIINCMVTNWKSERKKQVHNSDQERYWCKLSLVMFTNDRSYTRISSQNDLVLKAFGRASFECQKIFLYRYTCSECL